MNSAESTPTPTTEEASAGATALRSSKENPPETAPKFVSLPSKPVSPIPSRSIPSASSPSPSPTHPQESVSSFPIQTVEITSTKPFRMNASEDAHIYSEDECNNSDYDDGSSVDFPSKIHPHHGTSNAPGNNYPKQPANDVTRIPPTRACSGSGGSIEMTPMDLEIYQRLDQEYEWALEERDIAYHARYQSVRESACFAVTFMGIFLAVGVIFFLGQTEDWDTGDALLFSVYAITTVGYGNLHNPDTPAFQLYTIFFILIGIAMLTIMVAQVYQCIALEASRAQSERESSISRSFTYQRPSTPAGAMVANHHRYTANTRLPALSPQITRQSVEQLGDMLHVPTHTMDRLFAYFERLQRFLKEDEIGRGLSVLFPFVGLILVGALVVGPLEGWTIVEALYFSVVSLTTVGLGDYYPTHVVSIWFCIVWLPFSVGFMSLYLTNVAAFYIRLSDQNILRIEKRLRQRVAKAKRRLEEEQDAARRRAMRGQEGGDDVEYGTDDQSDGEVLATKGESHHSLPHPDELKGMSKTKSSRKKPARKTAKEEDEDTYGETPEQVPRRRKGFENLPSSEQTVPKRRFAGPRVLFGNRGSSQNRRERILQASQRIIDDNDTATTNEDASIDNHISMTSMRDVLRAVRINLDRNEQDQDEKERRGRSNNFRLTSSEWFSMRSSERVRDTPLDSDTSRVLRKPSFALRALVQERFAEIIATEVAGYQDSIEIQDHTLSVRIDSLRQTSDRWKVPKRARKAFRAVCFEVLFFVGEFGLVTRGAEALYDLPPLVFHGLFAPLLAALGDAEIMESWLMRTQVLAEVDLRKAVPDSHDPTVIRRKRNNPLEVNHDRRSTGLTPKSTSRTFAAGPATISMRS